MGYNHDSRVEGGNWGRREGGRDGWEEWMGRGFDADIRLGWARRKWRRDEGETKKGRAVGDGRRVAEEENEDEE